MKMKIEEPEMQEMMRGVRDADEEEEEPQEIPGCWLCGREASETSDFYCEVKYCCENHRLLHHPEDHEEPWPIIVKYKPGVGRVMVAARDIDQGEMIFSEEALVKGPNHTITTPHCLECLKELEEGVVCSDCGWPVCNAECSAGPNHQIECKVLTANREKIDQEAMKERNALYWPISALRVLLKAKNNPEDWAVVQKMLGHREKHTEKETWHLYKRFLVDFIRDSCGLGDTFTQEEVEHVSGMIDVNSIRVDRNGHGVYMTTAIMSHSCIANTKTIWNEDETVDVRAVLPIKRGFEITKNYVNSFLTTQKRQELLQDGWYFRCKCLRCLDPLEMLSFTSAVACLRCKEGLVLALDPTDPETEWACGDCGIIKSGDSITKLNDYFQAAIMEAKNDCTALEDLLTKATKMFHPSHYIPTLTRIRLNTAFLQLGFRNPNQAETELLMRRKEFLDEVHQVIETVEPGLTQRRGISLFERSACHLQLGRDLYDRKKFGKEDFTRLLEAEVASLNECIDSLEHYSYGTKHVEDIVFKANAARDDAESWLCQIADGDL